MKRTLVLSVTLVCLGAGATPAAAQSPIGFERWTAASAAESGVDFGLTALEVYQQYAAQLPAPGLPPPPHGQKDKRLIDIEIRPDGSGLANYVYDVVWIANVGDFKLDSWLITGLKEHEVKWLEGFDDAVILDIERYPNGGTWLFSVILQRNPAKTPWQVLTSQRLEDVMTAVARTGSRLVDIDPNGSLCTPRTPRGQACGSVLIDAVLVGNPGNQVPTANALMLKPDLYDALSGDFQLVDHEAVGYGYYLTIWVTSGLAYEDSYDQTESDVLFQHSVLGRVVDLEGEVVDLPGTATDISYYTVHLNY